MKRLFGNTGGLKSNHTRKLENLYRRRVQPVFLISPELARDIADRIKAAAEMGDVIKVASIAKEIMSEADPQQTTDDPVISIGVLADAV